MARAIIGGLISSNLITLIILPAIYTLFEGKKLKAVQALASEGPENVSKDKRLEGSM